MRQFMITVTALAVFGAMVVTAVTHAWAAHRKVRHPAAHARQLVQPVPTKRAVDPLYESCEFPWRHPELSCPGVSGDGG
jgi:hypothetical protein